MHFCTIVICMLVKELLMVIFYYPRIPFNLNPMVIIGFLTNRFNQCYPCMLLLIFTSHHIESWMTHPLWVRGGCRIWEKVWFQLVKVIANMSSQRCSLHVQKHKTTIVICSFDPISILLGSIIVAYISSTSKQITTYIFWGLSKFWFFFCD
jgi:hypothetical protein